MKFSRSGSEAFVLHFDSKETALLLGILEQYPKVVSAPQPLSKSIRSKENEANQRLLDEALAAQRLENQKKLRALLGDARRFHRTNTGSTLALTAPDAEWLLQIFNDVRVGSWFLLGAPENDIWNFELNETTAPLAWAMEAAGFLEMRLLEALDARESR